MELIIGDKVWSSWSMRPWLALKHAGLDFTETLVRLRQASSDLTAEAAAAAGSPSRLVPALKDADLVVWDSLAICEYVAELAPEAKLWPLDPAKRALGRSAVAEMHSGFASLRGECGMDLSQRVAIDVSEATAKDIRRIVALWSDLLDRFGGPFLLGEWSIADAFYTPVATRIRTYGLRLSDFGDAGPAATYATRLLQTPEYLAWEADALADPRVAGAGED
jgi:glutathione S-transferase